MNIFFHWKRSAEKFIFSSEQSGDEKEFVVACEDKFTFLVEASPEPKMNFSKRSAEKLDLNPFK